MYEVRSVYLWNPYCLLLPFHHFCLSLQVDMAIVKPSWLNNCKPQLVASAMPIAAFIELLDTLITHEAYMASGKP